MSKTLKPLALLGLSLEQHACLKLSGINTTNQFYQIGFASEFWLIELGLTKDEFQAFLNKADLFRIESIGLKAVFLLTDLGIDTSAKLAEQDAENLHTKIVEINKKIQLSKIVQSPHTIFKMD